MLFVLTGKVQIGKTRWLETLIGELESGGVCCFGIISPGVWRGSRAEDGSISYEKLGIESLFLPERTRSPFARRHDLAEREGTIDARWQSSRATLMWAIPDEALDAVNRHFDALECQADTADEADTAGAPRVPGAKDAAQTPAGPTEAKGTAGLLVVDELGRLELEEGGGFTSAVRLLGRGPTRLYQHALIVARDCLADMVFTRLACAWGQAQAIAPDDQGRHQVAAALGATRAGPKGLDTAPGSAYRTYRAQRRAQDRRRT